MVVGSDQEKQKREKRGRASDREEKLHADLPTTYLHTYHTSYIHAATAPSTYVRLFSTTRGPVHPTCRFSFVSLPTSPPLPMTLDRSGLASSRGSN